MYSPINMRDFYRVLQEKIIKVVKKTKWLSQPGSSHTHWLCYHKNLQIVYIVLWWSKWNHKRLWKTFPVKKRQLSSMFRMITVPFFRANYSFLRIRKRLNDASIMIPEHGNCDIVAGGRLRWQPLYDRPQYADCPTRNNSNINYFTNSICCLKLNISPFNTCKVILVYCDNIWQQVILTGRNETRSNDCLFSIANMAAYGKLTNHSHANFTHSLIVAIYIFTQERTSPATWLDRPALFDAMLCLLITVQAK